MLDELSNDISNFIDISRHYIPVMLEALGVLWGINILNWITGSKLNVLGIYPRHISGLIGIPFAPIWHGNFTHLLFNSVPLFFLGLFIMSLSVKVFFYATIIITVLSGLGVWCIGRKGIHIGASGLIAGYFGFVLSMAYQNPTFVSFFCAAIALYYFGGILFSLFPTDQKTSWEGHLTGFLSGILAMIVCTKYSYLL